MDEALQAWLARFVAAERLPEAFAAHVAAVLDPLAERLALGAAALERPLVAGICGAQASGKSTSVAVLAPLLERRGLRAAVLSLDDLYLTREERAALAGQVHPLFATRGVPGTHDVDLGLRVLEALARPGVVRLPRFDKARDTRHPPEDWPAFEGPADVVLFEGWCVGARPQPQAALAAPVNALEREADPQGRWRAHANAALAGPYQTLFGRLDRLILLQAPSFEVVVGWRREQEAKLRARLAREGGDASRVMNDAGVERFVAHYERLTRHILEEMPARADVVIRLGPDRGLQPASGAT